MRYLDHSQPLALLVLRIVLGAIMIAHGYHKVFGGMAHTVQFISNLGLPGWAAYLSAYAAVFILNASKWWLVQKVRINGRVKLAHGIMIIFIILLLLVFPLNAIRID